jgi:hypothetical protein
MAPLREVSDRSSASLFPYSKVKCHAARQIALRRLATPESDVLQETCNSLMRRASCLRPRYTMNGRTTTRLVVANRRPPSIFVKAVAPQARIPSADKRTGTRFSLWFCGQQGDCSRSSGPNKGLPQGRFKGGAKQGQGGLR